MRVLFLTLIMSFLSHSASASEINPLTLGEELSLSSEEMVILERNWNTSTLPFFILSVSIDEETSLIDRIHFIRITKAQAWKLYQALSTIITEQTADLSGLSYLGDLGDDTRLGMADQAATAAAVELPEDIQTQKISYLNIEDLAIYSLVSRESKEQALKRVVQLLKGIKHINAIKIKNLELIWGILRAALNELPNDFRFNNLLELHLQMNLVMPRRVKLHMNLARRGSEDQEVKFLKSLMPRLSTLSVESPDERFTE